MSTTNIYVLRLEGGMYYVGKSENVYKRYEEHLNGNGSAWTKKYKPLSLEKTIENVSPFEEDKTTKEYMAIYGIDKVRGGSYTSMTLSEEQEDALRHELRASSDKCYKCGKAGHFANTCNKRPSMTATCHCGKKFNEISEFLSHQRLCVQRYKPEESEGDEEEEWECDYCPRTFTTKYGCMVHERSCKKTEYKTSKKSSNSCFKCGREGHYASDCYAKKDIYGRFID
jgi:predicted GIY-YIG superfamily endonuclease